MDQQIDTQWALDTCSSRCCHSPQEIGWHSPDETRHSKEAAIRKEYHTLTLILSSVPTNEICTTRYLPRSKLWQSEQTKVALGTTGLETQADSLGTSRSCSSWCAYLGVVCAQLRDDDAVQCPVIPILFYGVVHVRTSEIVLGPH